MNTPPIAQCRLRLRRTCEIVDVPWGSSHELFGEIGSVARGNEKILNNKKAARLGGFFAMISVLLAVGRTRLEAIAAVHRLIAARLERNLGNAAALAARGLEHFTALTAAHTGTAAAAVAHLLARLTA